MQHAIQTSLLDKLSSNLNLDKQTSTEELYEKIRLNLEAILNSRLRYFYLPVEMKELSTSLLRYGLSDFMNINNANQAMRTRLCEEIKSLILCFEPRLFATRVSVQNSPEDEPRILKLQIEAQLRIYDNCKYSIFESSIHLNQHHFEFH